MPYKNKEKQREKTKERVRRYREKGVTLEGVTKEGVTLGGVTPGTIGTTYTSYFRNGIELVPADGILPERLRYLDLGDGQVLDRCNQPKADLSRLPGSRLMAYKALANVFIPNKVKDPSLEVPDIGGINAIK